MATWSRLLTGVVIGVAGYFLADLARMGPEPLPYAVMVTVAMTLVWLVSDTTEAEPTQWAPALPEVRDRVDEATADLRILTSHQQATAPSEAVRDRLVALARVRDPALADSLRHELAPARRLSPADIDRILTRIEEASDRS